jgi:hypothetical protein
LDYIYKFLIIDESKEDKWVYHIFITNARKRLLWISRILSIQVYKGLKDGTNLMVAVKIIKKKDSILIFI